MSKANKITGILMIIVALCVVALSIVGYLKYKDVQYINQNNNEVHVTVSSTDDPTFVSSGEYQYIDYKPQDKQIEFKKQEETISYNLDTSKRTEFKFNDKIDENSVKIETPNKKVKFSFFESYKDDAKTVIILNNSHKGDIKDE